MADSKTIAFFPEGAFGPALNSVGIAQACQALGHKPVFICDSAGPCVLVLAVIEWMKHI